jgi:hypothetical protein
MPTDATLTKIQKNRILKLVNEYGPSPSEFHWSEMQQGHPATGYYSVSVLTHRSTGNSCIFGAHDITISPGWKQKVQDFEHGDNFEKIEDLCGKWLVLVKAEAETPDLWASVGQEKVISTAASSTDLDNLPFTGGEQALIAAKLDEIKGYLLESQHFAADQAETVERQFEYLRESSQRLGRKDWLNALIGAFMGQAINLALSPEVAKGLLVLAATSFQSLWDVAQRYLQ